MRRIALAVVFRLGLTPAPLVAEALAPTIDILARHVIALPRLVAVNTSAESPHE